MLLIFVLYSLFSLVFIICKVALEYSPPLFLVGSRMLTAGALIILYYLFSNRHEIRKIFSINRTAILTLVGLAFFNIYLTNACEVWGLQYLSSAKTCFIYSLSPFASALFSYFLFSEQMSKQKWLGLTIGFLGFIPIFMSQSTEEELTGSFWIFSWAELAVCVAAVSSVYGWILLKKLIQVDQISPLFANGLSMLLGGTMALGHSALVENWDPVPVTEYLPFIECSILLILVSNFICYNLYGHLLKKFTATFMSFAGFTTPLFTALFGWLYFGEVVTSAFFFSMTIVFSGLLLFYREELKFGYAVKA
ncbi:MAG: DMT family transporter [Parachlamydiaceae bacterium]|nr:DMT family transporter [Parachlamydiaceae bacterium]